MKKDKNKLLLLYLISLCLAIVKNQHSIIDIIKFDKKKETLDFTDLTIDDLKYKLTELQKDYNN